ncbi:MAG: hypothetical protein HYZ58_10530 [Acidobacteria bacterium]|nr:hypothetical protein [Acidobacteriota bacterium]MBI3263568.1 hypothetical protein [Acidobacteriota bacterium]
MRATTTHHTWARTCLEHAGIALVVTFLSATPAAADATLFIGANTTPATRPVRGFAGGISLLVLGFEFEYANTVEDPLAAAPSLQTYMGNLLVQTPTSTQLYATLGGGFYRERLGTTQETSVGINLGAGIKFSLAGPLRVRLDYRAFVLRGSPIYQNPQRVYAGLNLAF